MYWSDSSNVKPCIERAHLDGSDRQVFINTNISHPTGLTLDYEENALYWCDQGLNHIERMDLGTQERTVIVSTDANDCRGLTLFGDYIYWTDV